MDYNIESLSNGAFPSVYIHLFLAYFCPSPHSPIYFQLPNGYIFTLKFNLVTYPSFNLLKHTV
jgi:hypothetical protein